MRLWLDLTELLWNRVCPSILKTAPTAFPSFGHKFIGCPIPSGVIVAKRSNRDRIAHGISYIGSSDTTITGSRNGHSPLFLWYALKKLGLEGMKARYQHGVEVAAYCEEKLKDMGVEAWRNPGCAYGSLAQSCPRWCATNGSWLPRATSATLFACPT